MRRMLPIQLTTSLHASPLSCLTSFILMVARGHILKSTDKRHPEIGLKSQFDGINSLVVFGDYGPRCLSKQHPENLLHCFERGIAHGVLSAHVALTKMVNSILPFVVGGRDRLGEIVDAMTNKLGATAIRAGDMNGNSPIPVFLAQSLRKALANEHQNILRSAKRDGVMKETAASELGRQTGQTTVLQCRDFSEGVHEIIPINLGVVIERLPIELLRVLSRLAAEFGGVIVGKSLEIAFHEADAIAARDKLLETHFGCFVHYE